MKLTDPLQNSLIPKFYFGGGEEPPEVEPVEIPKAEPVQLPPAPEPVKIEMPEPVTAEEIAAAMPAPVPAIPVPPPPTTSPLEAQEAADEELKKQAQRQGYSSSIIAGEQSRDYVSSATGTGSLLG